MEFMLVHTVGNIMTQEMLAASAEMGKKLMAKPESFAPGAKLLSSYHASGKGMIFCLWEAPNLDSLVRMTEQLLFSGWDTDIIPVDKMEVHLKNYGEALKAMKK